MKSKKKKTAKKASKKKVQTKKKTTKKKTVAKKKVAKKKTTKKKTAKKSPVKKSISKKASKKTTTKKASAKKTIAKKTTAKKAVTKKKVSKKVAAKKKITKKVSKPEATPTSKKTTAKGPFGPSSQEILEEAFVIVEEDDFFTSDSDECIERSCDNPATTGGYCRSDYIKNWKDIRKKDALIKSGAFLAHIKKLVEKFPNLLELILEDINEEKTFIHILKEMNIDASEDSFEDVEEDNSDVSSYGKKSIGRSNYEE